MCTAIEEEKKNLCYEFKWRRAVKSVRGFRCAFAHFDTLNCADCLKNTTDSVKSNKNKRHILSLTSWTRST